MQEKQKARTFEVEANFQKVFRTYFSRDETVIGYRCRFVSRKEDLLQRGISCSHSNEYQMLSVELLQLQIAA